MPVKKRVFVIHSRQAERQMQALCNPLKPRERPETSGVLSREYLSCDFIHGSGPKERERNEQKRMPGRGKAVGEVSLPPPVPLGFALASHACFPAC